MNMLFTVALACFVAVAAAAPNDIVVGYDLDDHEHTQKGQAGTAVTGSYSFTGADGVEHVVTYIADDKGYRVVGDARIEPQQKPTTARPIPTTQAPTQPPTQPPTRPPTQPPTRPPTKAPVVKVPVTEAPAAAVVQVVPVQAIHAIPVQYVQLAHAPEQHTGVQFYSGFAGNSAYCFYSASGLSRNGEQEVIGHDGARYILKKIE